MNIRFGKASPKLPHKQLGFFDQIFQSVGGMSGIFQAIGSMFRMRRVSKENRRLQREASLFAAALSGVGSENRMREAAYQMALAEHLEKKKKAEKRKGLEKFSRYMQREAGLPEDATPYFEPYDFNIGPAPRPEDFAMSGERYQEWVRRMNRAGSV